MADKQIDPALIADHNQNALADMQADYDALGAKLARQNVDIEQLTQKAVDFGVAIPSWGVGTGGTRFARFPGLGEPRNIYEKLADCAVIAQLSQATPTVSLHIPWDKPDDPAELRETAASWGLGIDAMNSNTFQDHDDMPLSFKYGSLSHADEAVREQAIAHNIDCIEIGQKLGSKALTVWIGDGTNFPGQQSFTRSFERYLDAMKKVYAALPDDWRVFIEYKIYEPAFYSTVIQDWGSNYLAAKELGDKAQCLVDLGHHAPGVNIEMIVARLFQFGKLGGFHFNDSKYGDDDLDPGSINPYQLFLVFNELVDAELSNPSGFNPAYMLDQSHNVTDPIESLISSAVEVQRAYIQALLVDRAKLADYQDANDVMMANRTLKSAYITDVSPILAMARHRAGGPIDPVATYRAIGYREQVGKQRPAVKGSGGGIV
ncbi:L-rhamnose catabolism isomerase [Thalassospira sp. MCCC 1A01428]|uniref:L-rhamnose catabolism isomerase n=1 Tax=Thalassospira sp. MCCC 1A01428 TaxID=1470575 RepID=UPI000A1E358C|nr:L-rhamnose catabolism isomerase [Thalassospira sp. MCCC 1A01428]OSQ43112.1 sugar isomerase [Thalassospira sp. MCCC 1A01428]